MADPFLGQIMPCPYSYAPRDWAFCNGMLFVISQFSALFSLLGNAYGGNGMVTFALPNLQCRIPIGTGTGPGLTNRTAGSVGGVESVVLTAEQVAHTHQAMGGSSANVQSPNGAVWAGSSDGTIPWYSSSKPKLADILSPVAITAAGGLQIEEGSSKEMITEPHENMPPFLVVNYIIAIEGIYPMRP